MTSQEIAALVGALVGLMTALQVWLVNRAVVHGNQLNGVLTGRITAGANSAIAADHTARGQLATPATDPVASARIAALQAEIASLQAGTPVQ